MLCDEIVNLLKLNASNEGSEEYTSWQKLLEYLLVYKDVNIGKFVTTLLSIMLFSLSLLEWLLDFISTKFTDMIIFQPNYEYNRPVAES